jgi:hypothetical protein
VKTEPLKMMCLKGGFRRICYKSDADKRERGKRAMSQRFVCVCVLNSTKLGTESHLYVHGIVQSHVSSSHHLRTTSDRSVSRPWHLTLWCSCEILVVTNVLEKHTASTFRVPLKWRTLPLREPPADDLGSARSFHDLPCGLRLKNFGILKAAMLQSLSLKRLARLYVKPDSWYLQKRRPLSDCHDTTRSPGLTRDARSTLWTQRGTETEVTLFGAVTRGGGGAPLCGCGMTLPKTISSILILPSVPPTTKFHKRSLSFRYPDEKSGQFIIP